MRAKEKREEFVQRLLQMGFAEHRVTQAVDAVGEMGENAVAYYLLDGAGAPQQPERGSA
mgnify:FL=1